MFCKIKKLFYFLIAFAFVSCSNMLDLVEEKSGSSISSYKNGDCYISFNLETPAYRTVLPDYSFNECVFNLYGTSDDGLEVLLREKVSYEDLLKPKTVSVKTAAWTFTVDCFDAAGNKILSGSSNLVSVSSSSQTIQIPMTFITGNKGAVQVSLTFPSGTDIAAVKSVKAGLYNSPLAAADGSSVSLDIENLGDTSTVIYTAENLESGLTKYIKFFVYSESGVELGHYTEAVIIGDNLVSTADLELTNLRSANVLTLTLKTNGSAYTGSEKTSLVLKTFPEEDFSYPMSKQGSNDTYSAKIVNGKKYILYDGDYNTKLIFIPTAEENSNGIVDYCDSIAAATYALENDAVTSSGLGLIVMDSSCDLEDDFLEAGQSRKSDKYSLNLEECTAVRSMWWGEIYRHNALLSVSFPKNLTGCADIRDNSYLAAVYFNESLKSCPYLRPSQALEYIYIPAGFENIQFSGLGNCTKLSHIVVSEDNEKYTSDGKTVMSKDGKTLYSWPSANGDIIINEGIEEIDSGTFTSNTRITGVTLPSTLKKIGNSVFSGCATLRTVEIPESVESIGSSSFSGCSNLKAVEIPKRVLTIGGCAFAYCTSLKSVIISESVTSIGEAAFSNCSSLESIEIPSSVKVLGISGAEHAEREYGVFYNCKSLKKVILHEGLEDIGVYDFCYCSSLKEIEIPSTVKYIREQAFLNTGLKAVNIPDSVELIGNFAFEYCLKLEKVCIGKGVNSIGNNIFRNCPSITSLDISSLNETYESIDNSIYTRDKKKILYYNCGNNSEIKIPEGVEVLAPYLFYDNDNLTKVKFPSTLTRIEDSCFYQCENISEIELPASLTYLGFNAFFYCSKITKIKIPDGITVINDGTFRFCSSLEEVILPSALTEIGSYAFAGTKLKEVRIPGTVTSFGTGAFDGCNSMEKAYIEEGVTKIGNWWIFWDVKNLKEVYLPKSMKSIYERAFEGCDAITDIYYAGNASEWSKVTVGTNNGTLKEAALHYSSEY